MWQVATAFPATSGEGKATAEVHDYHDELTGVLASSLAKRAPGYTSLGFPDPRKLPYTPSASTARPAQPSRRIYGGAPEDYAAALKKARRRAARPEDAS